MPKSVTFESAQADFQWWIGELSDMHSVEWLNSQIESMAKQVNDLQVKLWAARDLKDQYLMKG